MDRHSFFLPSFGELFGVSVSETTQNYQFGETTFRAYAPRSFTLFYFASQKRPFRTLNGKLTPFSPLRGLTGREQVPFLTGSSRAFRLTALH